MRAVLLASLLLTLGPPALAADWEPWQAPGKAATAVAAPAEALSPLKYGVRFFQKYISPVDGPRCPMYPTCSAYALQAIDKHGPVIGTMMTVDRLLHETDRREHRHPLHRFDRVRYFDPLENNDFWFSGDTD